MSEADDLAERIVEQLAARLRVPSAHDVADIIAPLIPTPADVADVVSDRLGGAHPALPALPATTSPRDLTPAAPVRATVTHLEIELSGMLQELHAAQRRHLSLAEDIASSVHRYQERTDQSMGELAGQLTRLGRQLDDRSTTASTDHDERADALSAELSSLQHELRSGLADLAAAVERLEQVSRRVEKASSPQALRRLTRTLDVVVAALGVDDAALVDEATPAGEEPPAPPRDHPLRHLGD